MCIARTCPPYGARCCVHAPKAPGRIKGGALWAAPIMRADPPAPPLSEGARNRAKWASSLARACACARLASMAACMRTCTYQPQMAMGWCHWATRIASRPIGPSQVRGSQGPSHMGLLPGSYLTCMCLACQAACMHIRTFSAPAGLLPTSVSRVARQRQGGVLLPCAVQLRGGVQLLRAVLLGSTCRCLIGALGPRLFDK